MNEYRRFREELDDLFQKAAQLRREGHHEQALAVAAEICELTRSRLGDRHAEYAGALNYLAELHEDHQEFTEARRLYEQAIAIGRRLLRPGDSRLASLLRNLARLHGRMGEYGAAEPLFKEVCKIDRSSLGEADVGYAQDLTDLALLYYAMGDYAAAEPLYKQAANIDLRAVGKRHYVYATDLNNLAGLYHAMGRYAESESLYKQAIKIDRAELGTDDPTYATALNNLAMLYQSMGDYRAALPLYQSATEIRRVALGEQHLEYAAALNNLAEIYQAMGDFDAALPLLQTANGIWRTASGPNHPDNATGLNNLAGLYVAMGNYAAAEPLYREALNIWRAVLGEKHPEYASTVNNLARLYRIRGEFASAEPLYRQALDIRRSAIGNQHPLIAQSLMNLAVQFGATGRLNEAWRLMEEAARVDDRMIGEVFSFGSEDRRQAYIASVNRRLHASLSLVLQQLPGSPKALGPALDLVLRRKAIGAEAMAVQRDAVLGGHYLALATRLQELTRLRRQIAQEILAGPGPQGADAQRELLERLNGNKQRLEEELARRIPEMALNRTFREATRQAVARAIPAGAVLVEFFHLDVFDFTAILARGQPQWQPARYLAFVLTSGEADSVTMIDLGPVQRIDRLILSFLASITDGERSLRPRGQRQTSTMTDGANLRRLLFDPLLPALAGRHHVLLAPDGDLSRLPFEALPDVEGRRLIDDFHFSYLATGRDVLRFATGHPRPFAPPLVIADPDFELAGTPGRPQGGVPRSRRSRSRSVDWKAIQFTPLPGTRVEGEHIAAALGVEPLLGAAALEGRLKALPSPRILHIATHGFFLAGEERDPNQDDFGFGRLSPALKNPLLCSGLALAGANTWLHGGLLPAEAEDGILTAEDVSGLDLLGTELVVLSACETGLGMIQVGEGVLGLRRAFVLAGAKALVMSLWKVPDRETQELMEAFHRRLLDGQPLAQALRKAQLEIKTRCPDPRFWGAFICQGDPGPLPSLGSVPSQ